MLAHFGGLAASPMRLAGLLVVFLLLVWASPAEATLGEVIKVVFVHGALMRVAEAAYLVAGLLGLLYLARPRATALRWSWSLQRTAFLFWLGSFLVSLVA